MNKRTILLAIIIIFSISFSVPALAQQNPQLQCTAFPDSARDVRVSYYMGEGAAYFASSQLVRAIDSFSCVIEQIDPSYVAAYMSRGAVYAQRRDYALALQDYTSAIQRDGSLPAAYNNRGIVYAAQQEYERARDDFSQAIELDGSNAAAYSNRGVIHALLGEFETAISDFEQSISISGIDRVVRQLTDPDRPADAPRPEYQLGDAQPYALLGIVYSAWALDNYRSYLLLTGASGDARIQSAAGALESRFTFDLRLDDGTWLLMANFVPESE